MYKSMHGQLIGTSSSLNAPENHRCSLASWTFHAAWEELKKKWVRFKSKHSKLYGICYSKQSLVDHNGFLRYATLESESYAEEPWLEKNEFRSKYEIVPVDLQCFTCKLSKESSLPDRFNPYEYLTRSTQCGVRQVCRNRGWTERYGEGR